jgi:hypothetical protein
MIGLPSETTFTYIYPLEVEVHLNSGKLKLLFARVYLSKQNVQHCKTYIILFCSQNNTKSDCRKKKTCSHAAKTLLFKVSAILKRFPPSQLATTIFGGSNCRHLVPTDIATGLVVREGWLVLHPLPAIILHEK